MAQIRYAEPVATLDIDVLVGVAEFEGIDILNGINAYCEKEGYITEREAIRVGAWPVQFVPVFNDLTRETMERADTAFNEISLLLNRYTRGQKNLLTLPWSEKVRMAEKARDSVLLLKLRGLRNRPDWNGPID